MAVMKNSCVCEISSSQIQLSLKHEYLLSYMYMYYVVRLECVCHILTCDMSLTRRH